MQGAQPGDILESPTSSRDALEYIHGLLATPADGPRDLPALLAGLARAFAAPSAGLASLTDGSPLLRHPSTDGQSSVRRPWEDDSTLLTRVREARAALPLLKPGNGNYLLAAICPPGLPGWLLWIDDPGRTAWTDAEAGALALAGHVLGRSLLPAENRTGWAAQMDRLARRRLLETAARLTRRLAHDFGNALTGILGFSDLSLSEVEDEGTLLHKFLSELHQSAQNGVRFVERLRQFANQSANPHAASTLGSALAREDARLRKMGNGVPSLQSALPGDLPVLAMDGDYLGRVLEVLLDNACEASRPGGSVRVSARVVKLSDVDCLDYYGDPRPGPHVEIAVADEGAGLSAEVERRLFAELFFTNKSRKRGLGLLAAYGILRAHHGGLCLTNRPEGGALARVVVPIAVEPILAPSAHSGTATSSRGEPVLVVDDDPMVLQYVSTTLGQAGYRVRATASGREALSLYANGPETYRLVVSDVLMPEVNGFDLARQLHERDAGVRVLFMSGHLAPDFHTFDAGGCSFDLLAKPFRPEALLRAVRAAIDRAPSRAASVRKGPSGGECVISSSQ